jgi:hypothetical protein
MSIEDFLYDYVRFRNGLVLESGHGDMDGVKTTDVHIECNGTIVNKSLGGEYVY